MGAENTEINLSYVRIGAEVVIPRSSWWFNDYIFSDGSTRFFVFGVPSTAAQVPVTGAASYTGVVYGAASNRTSVYVSPEIFDITGTSALSIDFATANLTLTLTFSGDEIPHYKGSGAKFPLTTLSGTGGMQSKANGALPAGIGSFYGNFSGPDHLDGVFSGRFYGPGAQEFGLRFYAGSDNFMAGGVSVGVKR